MVRLFAAESLSFLLRKESIEELPKTLSQIFQIISLPPNDAQPEKECIAAITTSNTRKPCHQASSSSDTTSSESEAESAWSENDDSSVPALTTGSSYMAQHLQARSEDGNSFVEMQDRRNSQNLQAQSSEFSNDERSRLAQSLGSLLFEVVKNIQNSFTGRLPLVLEVVFSHLTVVASSNTSAADPFISITINVFLQCLRSHTARFDSQACRNIENRLIEYLENQCESSCRVIQNFELPSDDAACSGSSPERLFPRAHSEICPLLCIIHLIQEWITVRPRPRGKPIHIIRHIPVVVNRLMGLLATRCSSHKASRSERFLWSVFLPIWNAIIQLLMELWTADPETMNKDFFSHPDSPLPLLSHLLDNVLLCPRTFNHACSRRLLRFIHVLLDSKYQSHFGQNIHLLSNFICRCLLMILPSSSSVSKSAFCDEEGINVQHQLTDIELASLTFLTSIINRQGSIMSTVGEEQLWMSVLEQQAFQVVLLVGRQQNVEKQKAEVQEPATTDGLLSSLNVVPEEICRSRAHAGGHLDQLFVVLRFIRSVVEADHCKPSSPFISLLFKRLKFSLTLER